MITVKGAKKGQEKPRRPSIAKDSASSVSTVKILYGLAEGEVAGLVDGAKSIYLDGTPLLDADGNKNFEGVTWDFRSGTNEQEYIQGFPDVSNETGIGVELKSATPYIKAFTDTQLSALRVRFKWNRLSKTNPDNGDVTGYRIDYAIDLQTDGGAYQNVLTTKIEDKTSAGYERTHRIDLPKANTGWQLRIRRLTPNDPSEYIQDTMMIEAIAEVIDVKLAYPNTALLGLQYNAETFSSIAKLAVHLKGSIIRVPSNYDAVTRTYTGIWDGTFKDAYSNNPAWAYYYLCTQWRFGLGDRLDATMIDKWSLYALGQYCDQMVSDGQGGLEPRFTCNVYLQKQEDAYKVLQNIAGIFRAMSYWNGERIALEADVPQDPVYTFSRANVIDGNFEYTGTRARDRHTLAKVAWDNPLNQFQTEYEYVRDEKAMAKFGVKVLDLSAFGCTSQAQAQRAGLWALKTEQLETRQVAFGVGLDGFIPQIGNVINISDELFAGRANGGRVSTVNSTQRIIELDREVTASVGDVLIINGANGKSERRNISNVVGNRITVTASFTGAESENVWAIETADLKLMRFRVMSIQQNDDATFNITAIQHEPQKYDAIDFGTDVKPTDITIINPETVDAPASVTVTSRHREVQGQTVTTLVIGWAQVSGAVAYDVEWKKDDGTWVKVPRTGNTSVEVEGVYSGQYMARVRAVSAFEVQSQATSSILTEVKGKVGLPPTIVGLTATGILFGMDLKWGFQQGSGDAAYTEIQVGSAPDVNVATLTQVSYPTNTHTITGLQGNLSQSYRARLVDKLGFVSPWSDWVTGTTDASADKIMELIQGQIDETALAAGLGEKIGKIDFNTQAISDEVDNRVDAISDIAQQMALISSGIGEQFDSLKIWHFDKNMEGWTGGTYDNGGMRAGTTTLVSPTIAIEGNKYRHVKLRITKVGTPTWAGLVTWSGGSVLIPEPVFDNNVATVGVSTGWTTDLTGFSVKLAQTGDANNYYKVDWIAVGRPSPAASFAALLDEKEQRQLGDQANATKIEGVVAFTGADSGWAGDTLGFAGDNTKLAGSWSVYDAIIDGDNYTGQRLDTTIAKVDGNTAAILSEELARVQANQSLAADVTLLTANVGNNRSDISDLQIAISTPESGIAASIDKLQSSVQAAEVLLTEKGEVIFSYGAPPAEKQDAGNVWFKLKNEDDGTISQTPHSWDGSKWIELKDSAALAAKAEAEAARGLANTKGETIYSSTLPSADKQLPQNTWVDTAAGKNTPKRWNGSAWVETSDRTVLEAIGKENVATFVKGSAAFTTEFGAISGEITTNQTMVNGVKSSIEVINAIGNTDKLRTEITKAEIAKNVAGVEAQRDKLNVLITDYTTKRTEATAKRNAAVGAELKAVYQAQIDELTKAITETTAERNTLNARKIELQAEIDTLNSLKYTESKVKEQYTINIDDGGKVSGYGLIVDNNGTSAFDVRADRFSISTPVGKPNDVNGTSPFMVLTNPQVIDGVSVPAGTYMRNFYAPKGSIDTLQIKDAAIKSAQIDNLAVTTGKIANLAVDTLQIKGQAVTVTASRTVYQPSLNLDFWVNTTAPQRTFTTESVEIIAGNGSIEALVDVSFFGFHLSQPTNNIKATVAIMERRVLTFESGLPSTTENLVSEYYMSNYNTVSISENFKVVASIYTAPEVRSVKVSYYAVLTLPLGHSLKGVSYTVTASLLKK